MKKLAFILISMMVLFSSCDDPNEPRMTYKEKSERADRKALEAECMTICVNFIDNYDNYLHFKYDGYDNYYSGAVTPPPEWIKVKIHTPELYYEFIEPIQIVWDSLKLVPVQRTLYEGMSDADIRTRIKIKELDKRRSRVKVKKSDDVTISTGDTYVVDSLRH